MQSLPIMYLYVLMSYAHHFIYILSTCWKMKLQNCCTKTNIRYPSYPTTRGASGLDCTRILFQFHGNNWQHRRNGHLWLEGFYWWGNSRLKSLFSTFFYIIYVHKHMYINFKILQNLFKFLFALWDFAMDELVIVLRFDKPNQILVPKISEKEIDFFLFNIKAFNKLFNSSELLQSLRILWNNIKDDTKVGFKLIGTYHRREKLG